MPWVTHHKKVYYYQPVRVDGRPRNIYLGCGAEAEAAAQEIEQRRLARLQDQAAVRAEAQEHLAVLAALDEFSALADLLAEATLAGAGCYKHHRQWRRRRGQEGPARPAPVRP
jgi:hypothetical protein